VAQPSKRPQTTATHEPAPPSDHAVFASQEPCWKCGGLLVEIRPPIHDWRFYCRRCEMLTSPRAELDAAMATKPEDAIGIVASWPVTLEIEPAR